MKRLAFSMLLATTGVLGCASAKPLGPNGAGEFFVESNGNSISWEGARAAGLEVRSADGENMWSITSFSTGIGSPVFYGQLPRDATVLHAPTPLVKGKTYKVSLNLLDNKQASVTFTP